MAMAMGTMQTQAPVSEAAKRDGMNRMSGAGMRPADMRAGQRAVDALAISRSTASTMVPETSEW